MLYLPSDYMGMDIPTEVKKILMKSKNKFNDDTILLINVRPFYSDKILPGYLLIINNSVIFFCFHKFEKSTINTMRFFHQEIKKIYLDNIADKMLNQVILENNNWLREVKFKYLVITNNDSDEEYDLFISIKDMEKIIDDYSTRFQSDLFFSTEKANKLLSFFAPEYCILRRIDEKCCTEILDSKLMYSDRISTILRLDLDQINYINKLNKGNELILASAGSGKSVLLVSKAIHLAKKNHDEKFVILTFNKNLCESYNWKITSSGMKSSNLMCFTYDFFAKYILNCEDQYVCHGKNSFDENREKLHNIAKYGNVNKKYSGIFIDEAQIFRPEWIDTCYYLLKGKKRSDHYFYLCGDKSQQVNNTIIDESPWERLETEAGVFDNVHRIDKNYRNTIQINDYLNCFLKVAKTEYYNLGIEWSKDENYFLRGEAVQSGPNPKLIIDSEYNLILKILNLIEYYTIECGISDNDIAIIFHTTKYGYETRLHKKIIGKLEENSIDFSIIHGKDKESYSVYSGIAITTIDSSLGLDFEAVILCGLENIGKWNGSQNLSKDGEPNAEQIEEIYREVNKLYTALSRARKHLCILLDNKVNWYYDLLKGAKENYDGRI